MNIRLKLKVYKKSFLTTKSKNKAYVFETSESFTGYPVGLAGQEQAQGIPP